jgi:hypothetical protein
VTVKTARAEIAKLVLDTLLASSTTAAIPLLHDNVQGDPPADGSAWARLTIRHVDGSQRSLVGDGSLAIHERFGVATLQLFTPLGAGFYNPSVGDPAADDIVDVALSCFERKATSGGAWFRNVRVSDAGPDPADGPWFMQSVIAEFEYRQLR